MSIPLCGQQVHTWILNRKGKDVSPAITIAPSNGGGWSEGGWRVTRLTAFLLLLFSPDSVAKAWHDCSLIQESFICLCFLSLCWKKHSWLLEEVWKKWKRKTLCGHINKYHLIIYKLDIWSIIWMLDLAIRLFLSLYFTLKLFPAFIHYFTSCKKSLKFCEFCCLLQLWLLV